MLETFDTEGDFFPIFTMSVFSSFFSFQFPQKLSLLAVMKAHELRCIWSYYCVSVFQKCTVLCCNHVPINLAIAGLVNIDFSVDLLNGFPKKRKFFYLVLVAA